MEDQNMASKVLQDDKENGHLAVEETGITSMNPPPQPSSQRSTGKDYRECPQTPVGRLPLSELLANSEDPRHNQDVTPVERVLWDNSPSSSATPGSLSKRKRKRAHSSSPACSSQNQPFKKFASNKAPSDAAALPAILKTPKADLVDDLWSRYSLHKSTKRLSSAPFDVNVTQFLHSSSPAAEAPVRDGSGLRRAFSCIDWPTSAAKRQKLRISCGSQVSEGADFARFDKPLDSVEKTKSRVSLLVEKIHDHLSRPVQRQSFISSDDFGSSPSASDENSPAKGTTLERCSQSQVDKVATTLSQAAVIDRYTDVAPLVLKAEDIAELDRADTSSDFDDDDLNIGMMAELNGAVEGQEIRRHEGENPADPLTQTLRASGQRKETAARAPMVEHSDAVLTRGRCITDAQPPESSTTQAHLDYHDEFGDDDESVTIAELEGVLAKYDTQRSPRELSDGGSGVRNQNVVNLEGTSKKAKETLGRRQSTAIEVLSDEDGDEYGGDSDFEQMAAEVAASQTRQEGFDANASVCTSHR